MYEYTSESVSRYPNGLSKAKAVILSGVKHYASGAKSTSLSSPPVEMKFLMMRLTRGATCKSTSRFILPFTFLGY
jgi:hypothetical protein